MRITGTGAPNVNRPEHASRFPASSQVTVPVQTPHTPEETSVSGLTSIFSRKHVTVSPTEVQALVTELLSLGINPSDMDAESSLRALVLRRNSIPLTAELVKNATDDESMVFTRLGSLGDSVRSILSGKRLPGEIRATLERFIADLDSLFTTEAMKGSPGSMIEDSITAWTRNIELRLVHALAGERDGMPGFFTGAAGVSPSAANDFGTLFEVLNNNPKLAGMFEKIETAAGEVISWIQGIESGQGSTTGIIDEAVALMGQRLNTLAAELNVYLTEAGVKGLTDGMVAEFMRGQVQTLENILLDNFATPVAANGKTGVFWEAGEEALSVQNILKNSGIAFEWRLLAWYRSGRDPSRLQELIRSDVKGILTSLLTRLKHHEGESRSSGMLRTLNQETRSLLDSISRRQISSILQSQENIHGMYFDLPFGDVRNKLNARIWVNGRNKPGGNTIDSRNFTFSFDAETVNLGRVKVFMNVLNGVMSLRFSMSDEDQTDLVREMQHELVDSLSARGFIIGSVSAGVRKEGEGDGGSAPGGSLDIVR
ncbi:flagellar hook-length control protein FliK [bacterium]|nr:flagellar hook-length control protein FliK [bacterium]